jgi:hypothetical protein
MPISPGDIEATKIGKNARRRKRSHGQRTDRRTYSFSVPAGGDLDDLLSALDHRSEFIRRAIDDRLLMVGRLVQMREEITWLRGDRLADRELALDLEHRCGVHLRKPHSGCVACSAEQAHQGGVR